MRSGSQQRVNEILDLQWGAMQAQRRYRQMVRACGYLLCVIFGLLSVIAFLLLRVHG
jgi:hypothetical protein